MKLSSPDTQSPKPNALPLSDQALDQLFQALSDTTRRAILSRVQQRGETVSSISAQFNMSMPAITKHLNVLENAGLIRRQKEGRHRICYAEPEKLQGAHAWLEFYCAYWNDKLDALQEFVEAEARSAKEK